MLIYYLSTLHKFSKPREIFLSNCIACSPILKNPGGYVRASGGLPFSKSTEHLDRCSYNEWFKNFFNILGLNGAVQKCFCVSPPAVIPSLLFCRPKPTFLSPRALFLSPRGVSRGVPRLLRASGRHGWDVAPSLLFCHPERSEGSLGACAPRDDIPGRRPERSERCTACARQDKKRRFGRTR